VLKSMFEIVDVKVEGRVEKKNTMIYNKVQANTKWSTKPLRITAEEKIIK